MKQIYFITTNDHKFTWFNNSADLQGFTLLQLRKATPEIQASNNRQVAEFSAKWAAEAFRCPVLKEDVGLYIEAYRGFPGPYLSHIEKQLGADGFLKLLAGATNRGAYWEYAIAYCEPGKEPVSFYARQDGSIAIEARGEAGWYADKLFIPEGQSRTIAELLDAKEYTRNDRHYQELREYLLAALTPSR